MLHPVVPVANFVVIGLCVLMFLGQMGFLLGLNEAFVLTSWNPIELLFSSLVHADLFHLVFNMWYLWVFGNAICAVFGNTKFLGIFFAGALVSAITHLILDGNPAVGASGAINTIIGVFLALYPVNRIHCLYFFWVKAGSFSIQAYWLIAFWFICDIFGVISGSGGTAFWAHIGGFVFGIGIGIAALSGGWVALSKYDNETLLDIINKKERISRY